MTRDEVKMLIRVMVTTWPNYNPKDLTGTVDVWTEMISDLDYLQAQAALKAFAQQDTNGFAPSVGQLRAKVVELTEEDSMTEGEAWGLVVVAASRSSYYASEEFAKLPKLLQRVVGSPNTLRNWAISDGGMEYARAGFQRAFASAKEQERQRKQLSPDLLAILENRKRIEQKEAAGEVLQSSDGV